jgi:hypothetical protein
LPNKDTGVLGTLLELTALNDSALADFGSLKTKLVSAFAPPPNDPNLSGTEDFGEAGALRSRNGDARCALRR